MTDKELINRAKTLRGNLATNGEKMSFADACKIVLLADYLEYNSDSISKSELWRLLRNRESTLVRWFRELFF